MKVTASMFDSPEPAINILREEEKKKYKQVKKLPQTRQKRIEDRLIKQLETNK